MQDEVADLQKKLPKTSEECLGELTDDLRLLVLSHMPLAYAMAQRLRGRGVAIEDLRQEGCMGLCEAALRYNEDADCTFATYARQWCRKKMLHAIRRHKASPDQPTGEPKADIADADLLRLAQLKRIDHALQCLTPQQRLVIVRFYGIDGPRLSIAETAAELGISTSRTSALHQQALRRLEAELTARPLVDYLAPWLELQA